MANIAGIPVWKEMDSSPVPADKEKHPVVIVGAGPVGLTLALDLAQKGVSVVILSKLDFIASGSKAICYAKRTLDVFDRLGVADRIVDKGVIWETGKVFAGDNPDPVYQFDMLPVKNQKMPGFINIQQYYVEEYLVDALADLDNVDIRWGHEITATEQTGNHVIIGVDAAGTRYEVETDWLLACDGSKSTVRNLMGLDFEGRVFEDNFLIADVRFNEERPSERWFWFDPPFNRGQSALLHKQPDDIWRLDFQLGWEIDRDAAIRPENVEPFVRGLIGDDVTFEEEWYSVYTFQCRRMARFVHDRVVFAGDSAHLVSPFGARGFNGGVADVDNLSWKLAMVVRGEATPELLESYNEEAIIIADENILNSTRSTDFMTPKSAFAEAAQQAVLELGRQHPAFQPFINSGRLSTPVSFPNSQLNTSDIDDWNTQGVSPGSPALDAPLGDGWLLDSLGGEFILMCNDSNIEINGIKQINLAQFGHNDLAISRYAMAKGSVYLIRPDQYVAARWHNPTAENIIDALATARRELVHVKA